MYADNSATTGGSVAMIKRDDNTRQRAGTGRALNCCRIANNNGDRVGGSSDMPQL